MNHTRRTVVLTGSRLTALTLAWSAGLIETAQAAPVWNKAAFDAKNVADVAKALGSAAAPAENKAITLTGPDIAENGAVVPVGVTSGLPKTEEIAILVEKNPTALAAHFALPAGTDPNLSTRVKMAQTSDVYALVKADGKWYFAKKEIKVTLGGCGG